MYIVSPSHFAHLARTSLTYVILCVPLDTGALRKVHTPRLSSLVGARATMEPTAYHFDSRPVPLPAAFQGFSIDSLAQLIKAQQHASHDPAVNNDDRTPPPPPPPLLSPSPPSTPPTSAIPDVHGPTNSVPSVRTRPAAFLETANLPTGDQGILAGTPPTTADDGEKASLLGPKAAGNRLSGSTGGEDAMGGPAEPVASGAAAATMASYGATTAVAVGQTGAAGLAVGPDGTRPFQSASAATTMGGAASSGALVVKAGDFSERNGSDGSSLTIARDPLSCLCYYSRLPSSPTTRGRWRGGGNR